MRNGMPVRVICTSACRWRRRRFSASPPSPLRATPVAPRKLVIGMHEFLRVFPSRNFNAVLLKGTPRPQAEEHIPVKRKKIRESRELADRHWVKLTG